MKTPSKATTLVRVGAATGTVAHMDAAGFFGIDMQEEMAHVYRHVRGETPRESPAIIQVIASTSGEGTTSVARELARVASKRFARCVRLLEITRAPVGRAPRQVNGLSLFYEQVAGADVVARNGRPNLRLGYRLRQYLRSGYDIVVVDSPSVGSSTAGLAFARHVDGVLLVVAGDTARLAAVKRARDAIAAHGGLVLGVVLNRR